MQQRLQLKEARVTHGAAEHWNDRVAEAADHPVPCWLQVMTDKNADNASKAADAKSLLKRYGSAYLVTSISFAAVSYAICYALVSQGTPPPSLRLLSISATGHCHAITAKCRMMRHRRSLPRIAAFPSQTPSSRLSS